MPCGTQWLKIRDGNSLSSNLLADLWGGRDTQPSIVNSTGPNLLLEYFSDEVFAVTTSMARPSCGGGFVGQAIQMSKKKLTSLFINNLKVFYYYKCLLLEISELITFGNKFRVTLVIRKGKIELQNFHLILTKFTNFIYALSVLIFKYLKSVVQVLFYLVLKLLFCC